MPEPGHPHAPHHGPAPARAGWGPAVSATLHCLAGCALGEVVGLVIGTALGWSNPPTIGLAVVLAFFFGYGLTLRGLRRARVGLRRALRLALAADTLSIAIMELVDNAVVVAVPGAMDAPPSSALFWGTLALALLAAFLVAAPVNKWAIGRGKGHAVIHGHHH